MNEKQHQIQADTQLKNDKVNSQIVQSYREYFSDVLEKVKESSLENIPTSLLESHRIKVLKFVEYNERNVINHGNVYIQLTNKKNNGLECTYEAIIGQFFLVIKMLNIHRNAQSQVTDQARIGKGSFGIVKQVLVNNRKIALKKINFSSDRKKQIIIPHLLDPEDLSDPFEIRQAIKQYCMYKICSMLQIGPQLIFDDVYDLVCYNDCIQFQMQLCQTLDSFKGNSYENDLKYCTALLHSMKFVHKDIKPPNVLYSPSLKQYVLTDFGISNSVGEELWQKTETYFQGSYNYVSPEMKQIYDTNNSSFVNLYQNDVYSLNATIDQIKYSTQKLDENYSRNVMSIVGSSGQSSSFTNSYDNVNSLEFNSNQTNQIFSQETYYQSTIQSFNDQFLKFSNEINFYLMKSLYNIHKLEGVITQDMVNQQIEKTCQNNEETKILQKVKVSINEIFFPKEQFFKQVSKVRNDVRIFGLFSLQISEKLEELQKNRKIPQINYTRLKIVINSIKKNTKLLAHKKMEATVSDLHRHLHLRNFRSLIVSLRHILKHYKIRDTEDDKKILLYCLKMFQSGFASIQVIDDVIQCIQLYLNNKIIKTGKKYDDLFTSINNLYKHFEAKGLLNIESLQMFFRAFFRIDKEGQLSLLQNMSINIRNKIKQYRLSMSEKDFKKITYINYELQIIMKLRKYQQGRNIVDERIQEIKSLVLCNHKFIFFDNAVTIFSNLDLYDLAQKFNEDSYQLKKKFYFPRQSGPEYAQYYFNKAVIVGQYKKDINQAINYYIKAQGNLEESIREFTFTILLIQTYNNLSICLDMVGRLEEATNNLERCYNNMLMFSACTLQNTVYILDNLIRMMLRMNKTGEVISMYFDQLVSLKWQVAKNRCIFSDQIIRKLPLFIFKGLESSECSKQTIIHSKKYLLSSVEPFLPAFLHFYCNICNDLVAYYINDCKKPSKALPYLWKFFHFQSKLRNDRQFYEKLNLQIQMLIKSNSSRKALKILKIYAYLIDDEYENFQSEIFKKMARLTKELFTKDRFFFNVVWKQKPYQNVENYKICMNRFENVSSLILQMCYKKKLKKLMPKQMIAEMNKKNEEPQALFSHKQFDHPKIFKKKGENYQIVNSCNL